MLSLRALWRRSLPWRRRSTFEAEMAEEMRLHLERRIDQHLQAGLAPRDARLAALRDFGGVAQAQEACRDQRGGGWIDGLARDLRQAGRQVIRRPAFALVAVLTLGFGIGANVVVFSVARAVLLRPLGFDAAEQLVWLRLTSARGAADDRLSWRDREDLAAATRVFDAIALFAPRPAIWREGDRIEERPALAVTPDLASVLRVHPVLGRPLRPSDAEAHAAPVVLVGYEVWRTRFGGAPDIIGRRLRLDDAIHTVVGVLPPGLRFPLERAPSAGTGSTLTTGVQDFWFPLRVQGEDRVGRASRMFLPIARLGNGVTVEAARAELAAVGRRLADDHPETNRGASFEAVRVRDQILGRSRDGIPMLAAAVAAILLVCCLNLANLLLTRGVARRRELAVCAALGAGRARLVQALLLESFVLSLLGGAVGLALAAGGVRAVRALAATSVPFIGETVVDLPAALFTLGLSLATALGCGLAPALWCTRVEAFAALRPAPGTTEGRATRTWQQGLLVGQIAAVLVLLASAALLLESFRRLIGQDVGYEPAAAIVLELRTRGFETGEEVSRAYRALHARLSTLPGVDAVGAISSAPLTGKWTFAERAHALDRPLPETERPALSGAFVAYDYFEAMGIRLREGRVFDDAELNDAGPGRFAILNDAAAALLFRGRPAVGGRIALGHRHRVLEVVGVVRDTRDVRLEDQPPPRVYLHYAFSDADVVVRSRVPSGVLMPRLRDAVDAVDRRILVHDMKPMSAIVSATVADRRFLMVMLLTYAAAALVIALVGIFAVVAFQVARRTKEFGVRLALGASPGGLARLVLIQAGRVTVAGLTLGLACAWVTGELLASQLFGVAPHDPWVLTTVSAVVVGATLLAGLVPARRAARVDPLGSLRAD